MKWCFRFVAHHIKLAFRMGIVMRQTFISSISAYVGVALGYFNVIILMPLFFSQEQIGLMRTIMAIAMLLVPLVLVGTSSSLVKYEPKMNGRSGQLHAFTISLIFISFALVSLIGWLFKAQLIRLFDANAAEVTIYLELAFALVLAMALFSYFEAIARTRLDIVSPNFFRELVYKGSHALVIVGVGLTWFSFHQYMYSHLVIYGFLIVGLWIVLVKKNPIEFQFKGLFQLPEKREILNFSLFSVLGTFGIMMVLEIDQIMVSSYLGLGANGIYTTAMYMAIVIELPRRLVSQISLPIISKAYHEKRFDDINEQYQQVSINLFVIGLLLFLVIVLNLENIYRIMPNGDSYRAGWWVVYLVGTTKLVDMTFSVNGEIISMSRYYKVNVFLIVGLGIFTIITNMIFIPYFGIYGAALATLITYIIFNLVKYLLLKKIYGFDPFTKATLHMVVTGMIVYVAVYFIPNLFHPIIDGIIRSALICLLFGALVYYLKPSDALISLTQNLLSRIKKS